ncbi:fucolectin-like [Penaeus monodon]|uniref:fucolectin-like n=1 Tax=Penaeus monodon TaxID=6687 RepID=UPI0018A7249C|nr:fucolectin-like [Penaeus monodon]
MEITTASAWACLLLWAWSCRASGSYYRAEDYQMNCFVKPNGVLAVAETKVLCAVRCSVTRCSYFSFLGGNCTLFDQGQASEVASRRYRKLNVMTVDVAYNKPTLASDQFEDLSPDRAVDGDIQTQFHSLGQNTPWWRVDLGENYCIQTIDVQPHPGVSEWFHSAEIRAGKSPAEWDFSSYTLIASFVGPYDGVGRLLFIPPGPLEVRYISIQLFAMEFLNLQDVKVIALVVEG